MNTKKFNLNWQSVLLGMMLCMVLVVFMGSKAANPQVGGMQQRYQQRTVNMNDVWEKTNSLEAKIVAMAEQLNRIEIKIDNLNKDTAKLLRK